MARLGEHNFAEKNGQHKDFVVVRVTPHEHYDKKLMINDIALLKLGRDVEFNGKLILYDPLNESYLSVCCN